MSELEPVVWLLVFVISVTTHEAAHAWAAWRGGDDTAYLGGQVSLNPIPHMQREPIGMVVVPLFSVLTQHFPMGWASTPFDPAWEERHPRRAAWMALAGPAANFALALGAFLFLRAGLELGFFQPCYPATYAHLVTGHVAWIDGMGRFTSMMLVLNTILCILNLVPFPPLDGASAITLLLPQEAGLRLRRTLRQPGLSLVGLLLVWYGIGVIVHPVLETITRWVYV
ncbi:MAG TPA: site-2 protease family protein [Myxococcota bacterium]|nr:site-2 protease family protein [Myxococcota bacterium]